MTSHSQENAVAAQRIVLTSPWRLGLFVFLLVVGTGFGLVYAYIELFGWVIDLKDEATVRYAYMVLGGVAVLGLLGYIAVVASARPLERVVRGSKAREHAIKRLGKVSDPRDADLDDFEEEPVLVKVVERWAHDVDTASASQLELAAQREALTSLVSSMGEAHPDAGVALDPVYDTPDLQALVNAINEYAQKVGVHAEQRGAANVPAPEPQATPEPAGPSDWDQARHQVTQAVDGLGTAEAELAAFVPEVAQRASQLAASAQRMASTDASGAVAADVVSAIAGAQQNAQQISQLREALETLAEESNKLAITMALQISRLGDSGNELLDTAEDVRSLSTRYQRIAADLRVCETEQASTLSRLQQLAGHGGAVDSSAAQALVTEAMGLDQNAEVLREVLGKLQQPVTALRQLTGVAAPAPVEISAPESTPVVAAPQIAAASEPTPEPTPEPMPEQATAEERVYEIAELGGRPLDGATNDDAREGDVHELQEFGAVEL